MARRPFRPQVEPAATLGPLRLIWRAAARYPGYIAASLVALAVTAAATLAIPAGFRLIIDRGFVAGTNPAEIARWFRYLGLIVAVLAIGTACRFYFVSWLGERVVADIRAAVHTNLLRLSPAFFEENSPAEIASRMTADTGQIEQVVGTTISVALRNSIMATGGLAYLFYLAPTLVVLLLIAVPVVLVPIIVFGRRVRKLSRESQDRVATVGALTAEVLGAMKIVQAFNQEPHRAARGDDRGDDCGHLRVDHRADVARRGAGRRRQAVGRDHRRVRADRGDGGGRARVAGGSVRGFVARCRRGQPAGRTAA
jgi:ATP-binding cassette subfamily B protein